MGLRFDPVGGGQFKQYVQELIAIEQQPIIKLQQRRQQAEAKKALFQEFKGKVSGLKSVVDDIKNFSRFREFKIDYGGGEDLVEVSLDKTKAQPGRWQLQVDEIAKRSSMMSNGFESATDPEMGIGYVVVRRANGDPWEIFIDEEESSLRDIAAKINAEIDSPVSATVIKDAYDSDKPFKLLITAKKDGDAEGLTFPEFYFLGGKEEFWIDGERESRNSLIRIEDYEIETESNDVPNFINGLNLKIKEARPGVPFTLTIGYDNERIAGKMKSLVDGINEVLQFINIQNQVDENSDTSTTMTGDTSLQAMEYRLRNLLHEAFPSIANGEDEVKLNWLHQLGVNFQKSGSLTFDENKFNQVLENDFDSVSEAVSGELGFGFQLSELLRVYTRAGDGLLSVREKGLQDNVKRIDDEISRQERLVEQKAKSITDRFARLQGTLGQLQSQQQYLTASLGSLGGAQSIDQLLGA